MQIKYLEVKVCLPELNHVTDVCLSSASGAGNSELGQSACHSRVETQGLGLQTEGS